MDDFGNRNDADAEEGRFHGPAHLGSSRVAVAAMEPAIAGASESQDNAFKPLPNDAAGLPTNPYSSLTQKASAAKKTQRSNGELRPPFGMFAGALFGLASAVLYTLANIALRYCVEMDPFLVSAVKAAPTVIILAPFLVWMAAQGEAIATSRRLIPRFMGAALVGQFIGNAAFQVSLGMVGLAVAVPITLGMMIVGAAFLGRVMLHEPVRMRTGLAMLVLIASVVVLSLPEELIVTGADSVSDKAAIDPSRIWIGSLFAAASGAAYALFGVMMRQALIGGLSAPLTMFISGVVGTISLWSVTFLRLGFASLAQVEAADWCLMLAAGMFNFTAFVALSASLKSLPVVAVNLINASQVALAAVAGILLFAEPISATLILGIALTFAGLAILAGRRRAAA